MIYAQIASWLAGKLSGIIIFVLACFGAILIPVTVYQTFQIYGLGFPLPIIGRINIVSGLKPTIATLEASLKGAQDRVQAISDEYSRRTHLLKEEGDLAVAEQRDKTEAAEHQLAMEREVNIKKNAHLMEILNHAKSTDERPLGPAVLQYLDSLRSGQEQTNPSH